MKIAKLIVIISLIAAPLFVSAEPALAAACPTGIIHRGNVQSGAAENTVQAFTAAYNMGYLWVETDTYFTSDGHPVLFHNATVDGVTNGTGAISSMTLSQFKSLKYKNGQSTSSLQDTLALFQDVNRRMLLEIKHSLTVPQQQTLVSILASYESQIHLTGFAPTLSSLVAIKKLNPNIDISYLAHDGKNNLVSGMSGKNVEYTKLNFFNVSALQRSGYAVRAWTPNNVTNWRSLKLAGVDAIITDKAVEYKNWVSGGCR